MFVEKFATIFTFGFLHCMYAFFQISGLRYRFATRFRLNIFIEILDFDQIGFCSQSDSLVPLSSSPKGKKLNIYWGTQCFLEVGRNRRNKQLQRKNWLLDVNKKISAISQIFYLRFLYKFMSSIDVFLFTDSNDMSYFFVDKVFTSKSEKR